MDMTLTSYLYIYMHLCSERGGVRQVRVTPSMTVRPLARTSP